jgi:hypothetical protein
MICFAVRCETDVESNSSRIAWTWGDPDGPPCPGYDSGSDRALWIDETRVGWPLKSLAYWKNFVTDCAIPYDKVFHRGLELGGRWTYGRRDSVLPYSVISPGFLINTLFYAAILWLIFAAPFALRRTIRRRRGCCIACGYPVGVSPRCTECGTAVALLRKPNEQNGSAATQVVTDSHDRDGGSVSRNRRVDFD